jgi:hypothetical protein
LGCQNSLEKVAAFLLELDRRLEQPDVMVLPMRRCDIADYLGTTLETVSRALSSLQEERILSLVGTNHRGIMLHDRSRLAQRATSLRKERQLEGIASAKARGVYKGGRPSIDPAEVKKMKADGMGLVHLSIECSGIDAT